MPSVYALAYRVARVIRNVAAPYETWEQIIAGAGTGVDSGHPVAAVRFDSSSSSYPNKWASNTRMIIVFDLSFLSGIPIGDIYAANIDATPWDWIDYLNATPNSDLYEATPASYTTIVAADYSQIGGGALCTQPTPWPYIINYSLTLAGVNWITSHIAGGYVAFGLRNASYDVAGVAPPWVAGMWTQKRTYGQGSSYRFKLTVYYYTLPSVSTQSAEDVTQTSATLRGHVTNNGGDPNYEVRFLWGEGALDHATGWWHPSNEYFDYALGGLEPNHSYMFQAQVKNFKGSASGSTYYFDTYLYRNYEMGALMWANWPRPSGVKSNVPAGGIAVVTREDSYIGETHDINVVYTEFELHFTDVRGLITIGGLVTERVTTVTATTAVLNAMVTASQYGQIAFEYGLTTAYGSTTPWQPTVPDPAGDHHSWGIYGLTEGQLYHVRAVWRVKTDDTYSYQYGNDVVFVATSKNLYLVTSYPSVLKIGAGALEMRGKQTMEDIADYVWSIGAHKQYPFIGVYSTPAEVARVEKSRFKGTTTMQGYAYYLALGGEIAADLKIQTRESK